MRFAVMFCLPRLPIEFDDVEGSQGELVALGIVCQCCLHIATTGPSPFARQIQLGSNDGLLQACCLHSLAKSIEAFQPLACLFLAIGIEHKHFSIDKEHHLHVSVDLTGHGEPFPVNSLFQFCAFHQHKLTCHIFLVVNGGLDIFLVNHIAFYFLDFFSTGSSTIML